MVFAYPEKISKQNYTCSESELQMLIFKHLVSGRFLLYNAVMIKEGVKSVFISNENNYAL